MSPFLAPHLQVSLAPRLRGTFYILGGERRFPAYPRARCAEPFQGGAQRNARHRHRLFAIPAADLIQAFGGSA
jgi:hypothetical protein